MIPLSVFSDSAKRVAGQNNMVLFDVYSYNWSPTSSIFLLNTVGFL